MLVLCAAFHRPQADAAARWACVRSAVKLLPGQFGEGGLRTVQRLRMDGGEGGWQELVAKSFKFELHDRVTSTKEWYYRYTPYRADLQLP